jgi:hypothetical protein
MRNTAYAPQAYLGGRQKTKLGGVRSPRAANQEPLYDKVRKFTMKRRAKLYDGRCADSYFQLSNAKLSDLIERLPRC